MKIIRKDEAITGTNSDKCKTIEYSFGDKDIDVGVATITGRYPESGYCVNLVSKELVYILDGSGKLCFEDQTIGFSQDDAFLIEKQQAHNTKVLWA